MSLAVKYQRVESLAILLAAGAFYSSQGFNILLFFLLLMVVDISIFAYIWGKNFGNHIYNLFHSYLVPAGLISAGVITHHRLLLSLGLIWAAHIALDRTLGYGLKEDKGFYYTHLGRISQKKNK